MATITQLRERSDALFTRLLDDQAAPSEPSRARRGFAGAPASEPFSWFDPVQAVAAAALSVRLSARVASEDDARAGLGAALDLVEAELGRRNPEQLRQGFALFVTHNREGRRLAKPRTVSAAPKLFNPPPTGGDERRRISIGGLSPDLDYWREDVLANEHHQHWHEVYPYTGRPQRDFHEWLEEHELDELVAILDALQPDPGWHDVVATSSPAQLARLFDAALDSEGIGELPRDLYGLLYTLNDRQGELFFYMHEQMLARYDAELISAGLARVEPFGPDAWDEAIAAGYDPEQDQRFGRREQGETLPEDAVRWLTAAHRQIADAIAAGRLRGAGGASVPIDRTNLGEAVEATVGQLHDLDPRAYPGLHNNGHMLFAALSEPNGVMANPVAAIRDQVFWQWHKLIDDLNESWQATLEPYAFDDAPAVLVRNSIDGAAEEPWASPDIVLCRTADLPAGRDPGEVGEELFGGDDWSTDFGDGTAGGDGVTPLAELVTTMESVNFGGRAIQFLTHEPFSYFIRVESRADEDLELTARVFLAPAAHAEDRRMWIEMDKFLLSLPARSKSVVYRPDSESSVVKRPVDRSPTDVQAPGGATDEGSYCDCGWPYTLLLPRGTREGMEHRLMVMLTDAAIDRVAPAAPCGSMSWCGAVDRYPDTRDMGYPFCRPFGEGDGAIRDKLLELSHAAARTVTIRHV